MTTKLNPAMIVVARESRGMTQGALASAISVSQTNLSRFERGSLSVSDEHLDAMSRVLRYPKEFFAQLDVVYPYGSNCLYQRKRVAVPARQFRMLTAKMNILRMRVARLLEGVEIEAQNGFHSLDISDYESPEEVAKLVRAMWKLPRGPVNNITIAIESAGGVVIRCAFPTRRIDAFSQWPPNTPPIFFVNAEAQMERCRYTLAHELGHIIMHRVPSPVMESEADAFAAEFLMPRQDIANDLRKLTHEKVAMLKPYWKVSMAALVRRAWSLDLLSHSQYRRMFTVLSKAGYRTREPLPLPVEEPTIISNIVATHKQSYGRSLSMLASLTNSDQDEFAQELAPGTHKGLRVVG